MIFWVISSFQQLFGLFFKGTKHQVEMTIAIRCYRLSMANTTSGEHNILYAGEVCSRCASPFYGAGRLPTGFFSDEFFGLLSPASLPVIEFESQWLQYLK